MKWVFGVLKLPVLLPEGYLGYLVRIKLSAVNGKLRNYKMGNVCIMYTLWYLCMTIVAMEIMCSLCIFNVHMLLPTI